MKKSKKTTMGCAKAVGIRSLSTRRAMVRQGYMLQDMGCVGGHALLNTETQVTYFVNIAAPDVRLGGETYKTTASCRSISMIFEWMR